MTAVQLMKESEADPTLKSKEEFFRMIDEAKKGPSKRFDNRTGTGKPKQLSAAVSLRETKCQCRDLNNIFLRCVCPRCHP